VILYDVVQRIVRDPVYVFSEIHRILKPGGWLLFCSPNASYYGNLVKIWLAQNISTAYSTQEVFDHDYRPYTIPELKDLFSDLSGLVIERLEGRDLADMGGSDWRRSITKTIVQLVKRSDLHKQYIFCLARKRGELIPMWPKWLYKTYRPYHPQIAKPLDRSFLRLPEASIEPSRFNRGFKPLTQPQAQAGCGLSR